ncbi:hypothetical protein [Candidatus Nitrosotalea sp. TS]|uniref:hypothetical protein n=1 Tax=Candidatus Nitrosotalea sp. TS TaxID=2341020 RepID=UPI0021057706|nr:hypothetical protein [Candidatus Nitrosotalea sp. TS]
MGLLIKDSEVTKENILRIVPKGTFLITIGDATTEKMIKFGLDPVIADSRFYGKEKQARFANGTHKDGS